MKNSITQITGDFIKKIGEIFKESEKLYETEEKIKLQTQNSATSLVELYIKTYIVRKKMSVKGLSALFYDLCKHGKWHKIQNGNRAGKSQGCLLPIIAY